MKQETYLNQFYQFIAPAQIKININNVFYKGWQGRIQIHNISSLEFYMTCKFMKPQLCFPFP